jgi:hypothetical protein
MDAVSHGLFGRLLGGFDAERRLGPGSRAAFVLGALAPDVDLGVALTGWDRYLLVHESWTHTIAASPIVALAVALTVKCFSRDARVFPLWCAAWVSAIFGHVGFDLISGSEIRLFAPVTGTRLGPHWLAMADALAIVILIAGTVWSRWRPRAAAVATILALVLLVVVKAITQTRAVALLTATQPEAARAQPIVAAINGSLFDWMMYERRGDVLRAWRINARTGETNRVLERRIDPYAEALGSRLHVPAITLFLATARLPFPRVEAEAGRRWLLWSDVRHCDATWCALSFGAELAPSDSPTCQVIRVGPIEQSRPVPPETRCR